ncbi:MAG: TonB-dependent receptor [Bacteroidota bacterium]
MRNPTTMLRLFISCIIGCQFPLTAQLLPDSLSTSSLKLRALEDLMDMDITIVSKRSERWFEAPAAVFVISQDDIRRSGARSIPEALRLAPSLNIAQVNSNQWAISTRGFTSTTANKLLVLIDGRSVYTQLYSGVFWDVQDVVLHDVDRIEVISGPGGTLWGTNAVNGIINIITKSSRETAGSPLLIEAGAGIRENFSFTARSGGTFGGSGSHRTYLKYFERDETKLERGGDPNDGWSGLQGGFRIDHDLSPADALTIQGDAYRLKENQRTNITARMEGGNILASWHHTVSDVSSLSLRSFFDYSHRRIPNTFSEDLGTFDIEFEHQMNIAQVHELNWGLGFRNSNDRVGNSAALAFLPPNLRTQEYNAFIQDAVSLGGGMKVTVGSKFSDNDFSGFEYQPRISFGWSLNKEQFLWASVTRAVRTPSRIDRDFYVPGTPPIGLRAVRDLCRRRFLLTRRDIAPICSNIFLSMRRCITIHMMTFAAWKFSRIQRSC